MLVIILVPRGRAPFGQHQESRLLKRYYFLNMRWIIVSYSQPIRLVRLDSEHAQSDGKFLSHGLPVFDLSRGPQKSRFLVLTKKSVASGDENNLIR